MGFTSVIFLFLFVPVSIILYYLMIMLEKIRILKKMRIRDIVLVLISIFFYGWAGLDGVKFISVYVVGVFITGKLIGLVKKKKYIKYGVLFTGIFALVGLLYYYKYMDFTVAILNSYISKKIIWKTSWVPLGISFVTFSAISYITDVYRGDAKSGSLLDVALYLTFFPKVVSGPIVLWKDFEGKIEHRKTSVDLFFNGLNRIMIGFGKKLILADYFGTVVASIQEQVTYGIDIPTAWGCVLLYTLQIYYDFSGYSDIAIGLSNIFGLELDENFRFPYTAVSITDFWRKWHISLGTWFKEYIYIPLGGNRKGWIRTLVNLGIVFLITGIWHGAGGNYIFWGALHGTVRILEKCIEKKELYIKIPKAVKWIFTMLIVSIGWQAFRFSNIKELFDYYKILFGIVRFNASDIFYQFVYFFDKKAIILCTVGILGATIFSVDRMKRAVNYLQKNSVGLIIQEMVLLGVMIVSVICMVNSTYSPFIYFKY